MTTGQRIKNARKRCGLTQAELARKLGIPYQSIGQWERDLRKPKYGTIRRIATALGVDWMDLVPEEERGETIVNHMMEELKGTKSPRERINAALDNLNPTGQQEAVKRVEELAEIPKYQRQDAPIRPLMGEDTIPEEKPPESP